MGLLRLLPEQVASRWGLISGIIKKSMPPTANGSADSINGIMDGILAGSMQCWAVVEDTVPVALLVTTIAMDSGVGTKSLCIYSLTSISNIPVSERVWNDCLGDLKDYARKMSCDHISAYTNIPVVIRLLERRGADVSTIYAKIDID